MIEKKLIKYKSLLGAAVQYLVQMSRRPFFSVEIIHIVFPVRAGQHWQHKHNQASCHLFGSQGQSIWFGVQRSAALRGRKQG